MHRVSRMNKSWHVCDISDIQQNSLYVCIMSNVCYVCVMSNVSMNNVTSHI